MEGGFKIVNTSYHTARYRIITDTGGNRYRFFCDISNAGICTTKPICGHTQQEELEYAWESEGRHFFNKCQHCGKWVCNAMFNPDTLECVDCTPPAYVASMEHYGFGTKSMKHLKVCNNCGMMSDASVHFCKECGIRLPHNTLYHLYMEKHKTQH